VGGWQALATLATGSRDRGEKCGKSGADARGPLPEALPTCPGQLEQVVPGPGAPPPFLPASSGASRSSWSRSFFAGPDNERPSRASNRARVNVSAGRESPLRVRAACFFFHSTSSV
jgi:hypothetical protein